MPEHESQRATAGERFRHWLAVITLTLLGLLVAELPVLSRTRDRVYLWLQNRLVRSNKTVVVLAIDDAEFWRGELGGKSPLNRGYLERLITKIREGNPAAIAFDIGFETNDPDVRPKWEELSEDERKFLAAVDTAAQRCPVVLPRTISERDTHLISRYDLFDAMKFGRESIVAFGHTSSAHNSRQIPTRIVVNDGELLDSFALAILRNVTRELPARMEDPRHPWPYSFFLPNSSFVPKRAPIGADGLLPASAVRMAPAAQVRKWLERQVVIVGGTWRKTAHGGDFADAHETPLGRLPGVVVHANYVQSLLWDAMYPMPRHWRLGIEIFLGLTVSLFFRIAHGWRRLVLVAGTLVAVVVLTWIFSSAIGVFFDMVVPVAFLGIHALWEGASEQLRLEFRQRFRYAEHVFTSAALLAVLSVGFIFARHEMHATEKQLELEDRLQVTRFVPAVAPAVRRKEDRILATTYEVLPDVKEEDRRNRMPEQRKKSPELEQKRPLPEQQRLVEGQSTPPPKLHHAQEQTAELKRSIEDRRRQLERAAAHENTALEAWRSQDMEIKRRQLVMMDSVERSREQPRVRLVDVRPSVGLFRRPALTVAIHHEAPFQSPTELIAFAKPRGKCAGELIDNMLPSFTASGSVVIDQAQLKDIMARNGIAAGRFRSRDAVRVGRLLGAGSLVFVDVHECKSDLNAIGDTIAGLTGRNPVIQAAITASVGVFNLETGVETSRIIDKAVTLSPEEAEWYSKFPTDSKGIVADRVNPVEVAQRKLVEDTAEQVHHLFFDWTEKGNFPFFDDRECSLQNSLNLLRTRDINGASAAAQASLDECKTSNATPRMLANAYYNRAITYFLSGDYSSALSHVEQAKKLYANNAFTNAEAIFKRVHDEVRWSKHRDVPPSEAITREDQLRRLEELYKKGLMTPEEYGRKRQEILATN